MYIFGFTLHNYYCSLTKMNNVAYISYMVVHTLLVFRIRKVSEYCLKMPVRSGIFSNHWKRFRNNGHFLLERYSNTFRIPLENHWNFCKYGTNINVVEE